MSEMEVVQLDVGGALYKVALDTLMQHPETTLAKLVSKRWRDSPDSKNDSIFIDRDKDLFKYILAWYRNGIIVIPRTVAISEVKHEIDYFGLPANVIVCQEKVPLGECYKEMKDSPLPNGTELFVLWALQKALNIGYLHEKGRGREYVSKVSEYIGSKPDFDEDEVVAIARKKIQEYGLESILHASEYSKWNGDGGSLVFDLRK
jgi:hypothetical protein